VQKLARVVALGKALRSSEAEPVSSAFGQQEPSVVTRSTFGVLGQRARSLEDAGGRDLPTHRARDPDDVGHLAFVLAMRKRCVRLEQPWCRDVEERSRDSGSRGNDLVEEIGSSGLQLQHLSAVRVSGGRREAAPSRAGIR
jgi:hypothetical protein